MPDCLARVGYDPVTCGVARSDVLLDSYPPAGDTPPNVTFVDMTDLVCEPEHCPAIIGNVIVYRDGSHVTATYMKTLAPFFEQCLRVETPWLFGRG